MKRINEFGLNVGTADERMKLSDRHKAVWKMAVSGTRQDRHDLNVGSHSGTGSPERFLFPKIWLFSKYDVIFNQYAITWLHFFLHQELAKEFLRWLGFQYSMHSHRFN